jgi:hypothetical protein
MFGCQEVFCTLVNTKCATQDTHILFQDIYIHSVTSELYRTVINRLGNLEDLLTKEKKLHRFHFYTISLVC